MKARGGLIYVHRDRLDAGNLCPRGKRGALGHGDSSTNSHMDSINQAQPEENRRDLNGADAVKKIKELVDKAQTCFFCTGAPHPEPVMPGR